MMFDLLFCFIRWWRLATSSRIQQWTWWPWWPKAQAGAEVTTFFLWPDFLWGRVPSNMTNHYFWALAWPLLLMVTQIWYPGEAMTEWCNMGVSNRMKLNINHIYIYTHTSVNILKEISNTGYHTNSYHRLTKHTKHKLRDWCQPPCRTVAVVPRCNVFQI